MFKRRRHRLSLHLSKCQIVGNLMPRLNYISCFFIFVFHIPILGGLKREILHLHVLHFTLSRYTRQINK